MIVTAALQVAASVAVGILATGCARNMLQARRIAILPVDTSTRPTLPDEARLSTQATVHHLQKLSREELLRLFCSCQPPSDDQELCRDWNGILLDNNNLGMTAIGSEFMSNVLFGKGRRWNGKSFGPGGKGINRFQATENGLVATEHSFDYGKGPSSIKSGTSSIILNYSKYQSRLSLWRTMTDEVRVLPGADVLIGFGAMQWSGGMLNSAPFCLFPADATAIKSNE